MRFAIVIATLVSCTATSTFAATPDPLPRRGYLGVAMDTKEAAAQRGVRLQEIRPGSSAEAAGLQPQDVLIQLGGHPLEGPDRLASVVQTIQRTPSGANVDATILRNGAEQQVTIPVKELPRESDPAFDTIYDAVSVDGALHRLILTMPRSAGPHPLMFYIQGVGCSSVEFPLTPLDPVRQFVSGVTKEDFATMRVEKSGCGDSQGAPCSEMDFQTEMKAYEAAIDYAQHREGVDAKRIFLFGHSMGGVYAPLIAAERPVAGIIVYGTIGAPLQQYFADTDARQLPMAGYTGAALEKQTALSSELIRLLLVERLSPGQAMERDRQLTALVRARSGDDTHIFTRHYAFWQQLDDVKLPSPWERVNVPVLALWGTSDFPATRADHPLIADTVNARHPGLAEFREVEGTGHGFDLAPTMADSMRNGMQGEFNTKLITICAEWMKGAANRG